MDALALPEREHARRLSNHLGVVDIVFVDLHLRLACKLRGNLATKGCLLRGKPDPSHT